MTNGGIKKKQKILHFIITIILIASFFDRGIWAGAGEAG